MKQTKEAIIDGYLAQRPDLKLRSPGKENLLEQNKWNVTEVEVKLGQASQASVDLRDAMRDIDLSGDLLSLVSDGEKSVFTRVITDKSVHEGGAAKTGVYVMGRSEKPKKMQVKTKLLLPIDEEFKELPGIIARKEQIDKLDELNLRNALARVGSFGVVDSELIEAMKSGAENVNIGPFHISHYYERQRVKQQYLIRFTGGLISVIADHCVASYHRPSLDQIEFEWDGIYVPTWRSDAVALSYFRNNYELLSTMICDEFDYRGITLGPDPRTKMAWITAEHNH